jgi:riboflavin synthase
MFTGIVTHKSPVKRADVHGGIMRLELSTAAGFTQKLQTGASIAVNGVCLTVTAFDDESVSFDVIDETLRLTNLATLSVGQLVNLERAAAFGDEIGGHLLSGHIQAQATLQRRTNTDENVEMILSFDPSWQKYVIAKGYIAINGCSLTIGRVEDGTFSLHLIPETLRLTNLEQAQTGTSFNIEFDHQTMTIVDTVERVLAARHN